MTFTFKLSPAYIRRLHDVTRYDNRIYKQKVVKDITTFLEMIQWNGPTKNNLSVCPACFGHIHKPKCELVSLIDRLLEYYKEK